MFASWCCFHVLQQPQLFKKSPPLLTSKGWRLARVCGRRDTPRDGVRADAGCSAAGMLADAPRRRANCQRAKARADRRAEAPSVYEPTHLTAASRMPVAAARADTAEASNSAARIFAFFRACFSNCCYSILPKSCMTEKT